MGAHAVGQGQLVGQLVEDLRLLASPAPCCIPGLLLPPLRATPRLREKGLVPNTSLSFYHTPDQDILRAPNPWYNQTLTLDQYGLTPVV